MPVGHVLPMHGELAAVGQQVGALQVLDARQYLVFGVGGFQGQIEIVQQMAEQCPVEQAEGRAGLSLPELFGAGGDVIRQGFTVQIKAEDL